MIGRFKKNGLKQDYEIFLKKYKLEGYKDFWWYGDKAKPKDEECAVIVFDENWNYITEFIFEKFLMNIDCYECGETGTFDDGYIEHDDEAYCESCKEDL